MNWMIRAAQEQDVRTMAEIGVYNWKETYRGLLPQAFLDSLTIEGRETYYRGCMTAGNGLFTAVDEAGTVLGFAVYKPDRFLERCVYLDSLHTSIQARGKGIGSALICAVAAAARAQGAEQMTVSILVGNDHAAHLYQKLGAEHLKYFTDDGFFGGVSVQSEKLIWRSLDIAKR